MTTLRSGHPDMGGATSSAPIPLVEPRDGVPEPIASPAALAAVVDAFASTTGPVAVDAERASGYRYGQRAYLVQLRREPVGTVLLDPIACPDLSALGAVIADAEWVLHAAGQDLPCLAEVGLRPTTLFDTELAGRLAGLDRVGLAAMVEGILGYALEKGHSAADWSQRPLPEAWLRYAALDVELLVALRDALLTELDGQGKLAWARAEFAALAAMPPPAPRTEPWRRTSGIHRLRTRRELAALRGLWEARDGLARSRDVAPGRLLPDAAMVQAVLAGPTSVAELVELPVFRGRHTRRHGPRFLRALTEAAALPIDDLPPLSPPSQGPPSGNRWGDRDPAAAERLAAARAAVTELAGAWRLPAENLLPPDAVRRLAWSPPERLDAGAVGAALVAAGARRWQVELTAEPLSTALSSLPS